MESKTLTQEFKPLNQRLEDDEIDLFALWDTLWHRKWGIISLIIIVMMLATLIVLNITPIYRAVATLLIEQRAAKVVSIEEIYGLDGMGNEYLETQFELLKSRDLAERVVRELNLTEHPEFDPRQQPKSLIDFGSVLEDETPTEQELFDGIVVAFMERISVNPVKKTQLVKIEVDMADANMATLAANALGNAYIESQLEAKLNMTQTAASWMNERLGSLKEKLNASEYRLQEFRERENLVDIEGVTTVSAGELSQTGDRLIDARSKRAEAQSQYRQVSSLGSKEWSKLAAVPAVLSNLLVQQFKAEEAKARSKVQELSRRYGPKHPKMIGAQTELNSTTTSLKTQVEQVVASIHREYQLAAANEGSLKNSFQRNKEEIQDIKRKEFKFRELQREADGNRQLYDTFMTRFKETTATQGFDAVNARIVDKAVLPVDPVKPKKSLIVMIAGVLSAFVGVALTLLLEALNNTFKSTQDVETKLNLPILGVLPLLKNKEPKDLFRLFTTETDKSFSESIRTIRTTTILSEMVNPHHVILVTSSVPDEGKSTVSSNLSMALGQMEKVLLLDADLRRPSLLKGFDLPVGSPGLANLVAGTARMEDCIKRIDDVIDFIPAGTVPPNPQELLSTSGFVEILDSLKKHYDRIIIDSPPTLAVSDSIVLSKLANAVIYVVKAESTAIPLAQRGVGQLLQSNAPVTGVVLNQVDIEKSQKYGYGSKYKYDGYYDYYGYSSEKS